MLHRCIGTPAVWNRLSSLQLCSIVCGERRRQSGGVTFDVIRPAMNV